MRLTKDNCRADCSDSFGKYECDLTLYPSDIPNNTKVIEVPKVWRENGKQYKVTHLTLLAVHGITIRAYRDCNVWGAGSCDIEYYD